MTGPVTTNLGERDGRELGAGVTAFVNGVSSIGGIAEGTSIMNNYKFILAKNDLVWFCIFLNFQFPWNILGPLLGVISSTLGWNAVLIVQIILSFLAGVAVYKAHRIEEETIIKQLPIGF